MASIEEFVSITGSDQKTAKHFLDACSDNLQRAIEMYMDGKSESAAGPSAAPSTSEDSIRAPIPQTSGVLIDSPQYVSASRLLSRRRPRSVFDGFRDFKAETTLQEGLASNSSEARRGRKRLEDLFRPPLELTHRGTFETARESGRVTSKWLMVNVQNTREFSCQVLNRDVWSKKNLQDLIRTHFIFWQVYIGSEEGDRFTTFYSVKQWPHVSILDPRTGERLAVWNDINVDNFEGRVAEFLADHGSMNQEDEESSGPPSKRLKADEYSLIDRSEDSQLAAAIAASLAEAKSKSCTAISDLDEDYVGSNDETSDFSGFDISDEDNIVIDDSDPEDAKTSETLCPKTTQNSTGISKNDSINQTKVDERFFSGASYDSSRLKNGNSRKSNDNPSEKLYKKIKSKLKIGSIPNGRDMSSLTKDTFSNSGSSNSACINQKDECRIMIRYPDGAREEIAMDRNLTLEALSSKLIFKGYPRDVYDLVTHFPRKNLYSLGLDKTLKEIGLYPRSAVFVEEIER